MEDKDLKRITRLTALLTQLQTRRLTNATELAEKFGVSVRTVYRDIRTLERAGVPIVTEEGKGYSLLEGYRIPPIMFSEREANALVLAEQLVLKNPDASFVRDYTAALQKVQAVLRYDEKDKSQLLTERTHNEWTRDWKRTSTNLSDLQHALTNFRPVRLTYVDKDNRQSQREVEPFALLSTENWLLVAWCRLRKDFRYFRLDRVKKLEVLAETFAPHRMTLQEFFDRHESRRDP